jgi:hypothetical protein
MEQRHHKIENAKSIIYEYFTIPETYKLDSQRQPAPLIKKIIGYLSQKHFSATQKEIANYLGLKNHSNVSIGISTLLEQAEHNGKLRKQLKDLDRIMIEKGFSKLSGKNNDWYYFLDLNNFIVATKGESSVLWHKTEIDKIKEILGEGWEYTEHKSTGKFLYKRK